RGRSQCWSSRWRPGYDRLWSAEQLQLATNILQRLIMPILRYTTSVSAQKTLSEITAMLVKHKAEAILVEFADGQPVALSFKIATEFGPLHFRLPANTQRVYQTLVRAAGVPRANRTREHAARVGWRLVKN